MEEESKAYSELLIDDEEARLVNNTPNIVDVSAAAFLSQVGDHARFRAQTASGLRRFGPHCHALC